MGILTTFFLLFNLTYLCLSNGAENVQILKPRPRRTKEKLHDSFVSLTQQPHDIAFYGDSITHHFQESPIWQNVYVPLKAVNFGIPGDRAEELWWRLRNGELQSSNPPKVMIVMIGTNNLWNTTNAVLISTINGLLTDAHEISPSSRVILLGIFPRGPNPTDPYRARVTAVNKQLASFENRNWLYYLDFGAKFIEPNGTITEDMMPDSLHLGETGYGIWEREMKPLLTQLLAMPPLPVEPSHEKSNHTRVVNIPKDDSDSETMGSVGYKKGNKRKGRKKGNTRSSRKRQGGEGEEQD